MESFLDIEIRAEVSANAYNVGLLARDATHRYVQNYL